LHAVEHDNVGLVRPQQRGFQRFIDRESGIHHFSLIRYGASAVSVRRNGNMQYGSAESWPRWPDQAELNDRD
jgi:hypothetical protein